MTVCKFCSQEIVWVQKTGDPKPKPYNASDLTPHECEASKAAYASRKENSGGYHANPKDSRSIENQVCLKEIGECWRVMYNTTPECASLEDAARDIAAGYRILRDAMREAPL